MPTTVNMPNSLIVSDAATGALNSMATNIRLDARWLLRWIMSWLEPLVRSDTEPVECLLGCISAQLGVWIMLPGRHAQLSLLLFGATPHELWGAIFLAVGMTRLVLLMTGRGRELRVFLAFCSCILWITFAQVFAGVSNVYPSGPIFVSFSGASIWILLRSRMR